MAHHVIGAVLCGASWFTLIAMVVSTMLGFTGPGSATVDLLFGIPAAFRIFGWAILAFRGTWLALTGLVIDAALATAVMGSTSGDVKGNLLLLALLASNSIPAWWLATGRRVSAAFGVVGGILTAVAWTGIEGRMSEELLLPLLAAAVVCSWFADAAIAYWALQQWRQENLEHEAQPF